MVEAAVLEDRGLEVCYQYAVYQDMRNHMGGERFGGGGVGKGALLAKALEGVCCVVTTWTEGFIAFGGVEAVGIISIKAVTCHQLDIGRPVPMVKGLQQSGCVRQEAVAIGLAKGDIGKVDSLQQMMVVMFLALEGSILARDRGRQRGGRGG